MKKTFLVTIAGLILALTGTAQAFERIDCNSDPSSDNVALPAGVEADQAIPAKTFSLVKTGLVKGQETYELTDSRYGTKPGVYFLKQEDQKLVFISDSYFIDDRRRTILMMSEDSGVSYQTHGGVSEYGNHGWSVTVQYKCILK